MSRAKRVIAAAAMFSGKAQRRYQRLISNNAGVMRA